MKRGDIQKLSDHYRVYSDDIFYYNCDDYETALKIQAELINK